MRDNPWHGIYIYLFRGCEPSSIKKSQTLKNRTMKIRIYLFALMMAVTSFATTTQAATLTAKEQSEMRVTEIKQRVEQIRSMDLSSLSKTERVNLKQELKGMNKELRQLDGVIYISVGALILIIVILILIL